MPLETDQIDARLAYARGLDTYEEQRRWYSRRAGQLKQRAQVVDLIVIGTGAMIAALPALIPEAQVPRVVSVLGILVAVLQAGQKIYRSAEIWPEYREASEAMKREMRLFAYGTGAYDCDLDAATALYHARLEEIISTEQSSYFEAVTSSQANASAPGPRSKPKSGP